LISELDLPHRMVGDLLKGEFSIHVTDSYLKLVPMEWLWINFPSDVKDKSQQSN